MAVNCKNTVLNGVTDVLIAAEGALESTAVSLGATNGGVTITPAIEKTDIVVDQGLLPVRKIATAAQVSIAIPLAEITLDNISKAFGLDIDTDGALSIPTERYYQVWLKTKGVINTSGKQATRTFYFKKVAFNGDGELSLSRTEQQTLTLNGSIVDCPTDGENVEFGTITDVFPQ